MSEETQTDEATFRAVFPDIQTAIKIAGGGNGMRIQLDIPEIELHKALPLLNWRQRELVITISPAPKKSWA